MSKKAEALLEGAGDVHVHVSPSLVPNRKSDVWGLIESAERRRMAFAVVKWHHGDSFSMAQSVNAHHRGPFDLYGGLVLNRTVGGLNPFAVDAALTLGAKIVWLPTLDAAGHGSAIGQLGGFPFQQVRRRRFPSTGLSLLDEDGRLLPEVKEILELVSGSGTVLASGHVTTSEIRVLQQYIARESLEINLLVNHIDFSVPQMSAQDVAALAAPNVWFELAYFTVSQLGHSSASTIKGLIQHNPDAQFVLASDSGQEKNPISPDAMLALIDLLLEAGIAGSRIDRMLHRDTYSLLGFEIR